MISANEIYLFLKQKSSPVFSNLNEKISVFKTIDSTNNEAKKFAFQLSETNKSANGYVIISEGQTAGRGRMGHTFYSPEGTGLYLSAITEPIIHLSNPALVTASTAVAICRTIKKCCNVEPSIKWVNDIFLNKKKICGILSEGIINNSSGLIETVVIGIGLNVRPFKTPLPSEISEIAGSLNDDKINLNELIAELLVQLYTIFLNPSPYIYEELISEYKSLSPIIGKEVTVVSPNFTYPARVIDITDQAHLLVSRENGKIVELQSGEVSIKF